MNVYKNQLHCNHEEQMVDLQEKDILHLDKLEMTTPCNSQLPGTVISDQFESSKLDLIKVFWSLIKIFCKIKLPFTIQ